MAKRPTTRTTLKPHQRIEKDSSTWVMVREFLMAEIATSSEAIDSHGLDLVETEYHRGRKAVAIELLKLAKRPNERSDDLPSLYPDGGPDE